MIRWLLATCCVFILTDGVFAQTEKEPAELAVLEELVGVWDAEFEVWPSGPDQPSIKFKGVETTRGFGRHWVASDLETTFMGQKMIIHSIIGYDLDRNKLVGTQIDQGPYRATLTGDYDPEKKAVTWTVRVKDPQGKPMVQKTTITSKSKTERVQVLNVAGDNPDEYKKFMRVRYVKRESKPTPSRNQ